MNAPVKATSFLIAADTHKRIKDAAHESNVSMTSLLNATLANAFPAPAPAKATTAGRTRRSNAIASR